MCINNTRTSADVLSDMYTYDSTYGMKHANTLAKSRTGADDADDVDDNGDANDDVDDVIDEFQIAAVKSTVCVSVCVCAVCILCARVCAQGMF